MRTFDERLLRLKQELKTDQDKDVAALLGLSKAAFSDRKGRDSFPEDKLLALKAKRPDLAIDVDYVLTGLRSADVRARVEGLRERLREVRGEQSIEAFADELGLEAQHLQDVENGTASPGLALFKALVQTRPEMDVLWFFTGQRQKLDGDLSPREVVLVTNYRAADARGKAVLSRLSAYLAQPDLGSQDA
jgi:transcriptional regulator with XRE-family HTH domain